MNNNVDIVITWVDGSDPNWLAEKKMYTKKSNNVRYRDWDNLVYIFRGIEQFMPWVHKIYFVTWGHLPKWLNIDNEKLVIVNHQDYIPEKYLPTFNSNVLDLNMFRIPGLSEQYINFNDDTFVIKPTKLEDFFYNGKPKDMACISPQPINRDMIMNIELNNMEIINDYFSINDIKRNKKKWLNFKMYGSYAIRTLIFMRFKTILGFFVPHIPISHLKSVVEELWEKEYAEYDKTCMHKFRTKEDGVNCIFTWTNKGNELLNLIAKEKNICIQKENIDKLKYAQPNHFNRRCTILYKTIAMRMFFRKSPKYAFSKMFLLAKYKSLRDGFRIFKGTVKRILQGRI